MIDQGSSTTCGRSTGIRVAVVRDQVAAAGAARKISLRAGDDHTDVSVLARKFGGGGFTCGPPAADRASDEIVSESP